MIHKEKKPRKENSQVSLKTLVLLRYLIHFTQSLDQYTWCKAHTSITWNMGAKHLTSSRLSYHLLQWGMSWEECTTPMVLYRDILSDHSPLVYIYPGLCKVLLPVTLRLCVLCVWFLLPCHGVVFSHLYFPWDNICKEDGALILNTDCIVQNIWQTISPHIAHKSSHIDIH